MINVELSACSGDGIGTVGVSVGTHSTAEDLVKEPAARASVLGGSAPNDTNNLEIKRPHSPTNKADGNSGTADELTGRPRIIYLKDFGAIASHAQLFLKELILAVRSRRTALQSSVGSAESYDTSKIQPTVIVLGVSLRPEHERSGSRAWSNFANGCKRSGSRILCELCPEINQPPISSSTTSIANILADALCATPDRVTYANVTYKDPDIGHGAIYRTIIPVHGFFDSRDPSIKSTKGDRGGRKPDHNLWRKEEAIVQKERKDEFAPLYAARSERRLAANEDLLRKALVDRGGIIQQCFGIFSTLPEGNLRTGSNKSKKTEELEAEKYATLSGLRSNEFPEALANQIAAMVLHELSSSKLTTPASEVSRAPFGSSAPSLYSPPTKAGELIVSPEDVATAITATIAGNHQLNQYLDSYQDHESSEEKKEDPVAAKVRSSSDLGKHEKQLLGCIIDTSELTASRNFSSSNFCIISFQLN